MSVRTRRYNLIVVFSKDCSHLLFCKRTCAPFIGKCNFVGGKIEDGESSQEAAERELYEETGIIAENRTEVKMLITLAYPSGLTLEVFETVLTDEVLLVPEKNLLYWVPVSFDFSDDMFASSNISYIVKYAVECLGH